MVIFELCKEAVDNLFYDLTFEQLKELLEMIAVRNGYLIKCDKLTGTLKLYIYEEK